MPPRRVAALALPVLAALAGCGASPTRTVSPDAPPDRLLTLGSEARGDTSSPDERSMSTCKAGGRAGQALDHLYGFEVEDTASYRFVLRPEFWGVVQVQQKDDRGPGYFGIGCAAAKSGETATLSVALEPGLYHVVVDGYSWDEDGDYSLSVQVDTSPKAMIRAEEPAKLEKLIAQAETVALGSRALGIYESMPGGARPSCGLVGGNVVKKIALEAPARVRVRAAAHFFPSLEVRATGGASLGCARAKDGEHDVELTVELPAGESLVVLDSTRIGKRYRHFYAGGAVTGAYVIDVEEAPP